MGLRLVVDNQDIDSSFCRRFKERIPVSWAVRIRFCDKPLFAHAVNISSAGMMVRSEALLSAGTRVPFDVYGEFRGNSVHIKALGVVRHCARAEGYGDYHIGIGFERIANWSRGQLDDFFLEHEKLGTKE